MVEAWGVPPVAFVAKLVAMRENFLAMKRERVAPGKILLRMRWRGYDRFSCRSARTGRRRERYEGRDVGIMEGQEPGSRCRYGIDYRCKGVARSGDPVARRCDEIWRPSVARHVVDDPTRAARAALAHASISARDAALRLDATTTASIIPALASRAHALDPDEGAK
jgi:hypothetical protein